MAARMKDKGLLNHLKRWGLEVEVVPGWRKRGRPYNFRPRGIIAHHTASGSQTGNFGSESTVVKGRPGIPGPLSQFLLGRDGTVKVVASGYSNHAGTGGPKIGVKANLGNSYLIGIEAENNGLGERWSARQLNAYYRLCAALLVWIGSPDASLVIGHKEWAPGRKPDPAGINMAQFRTQVREALRAGPNLARVEIANLVPGTKHVDIRKVKRRLRKRGYQNFGLGKKFGKKFRKQYRAFQRDLGYTGQDADGIPGRESLLKLGIIAS